MYKTPHERTTESQYYKNLVYWYEEEQSALPKKSDREFVSLVMSYDLAKHKRTTSAAKRNGHENVVKACMAFWG